MSAEGKSPRLPTAISILVLAAAPLAALWETPPVSTSLARTSCVELCPLKCDTPDETSSATKRLEDVLLVCSRLPTWNLSSFLDLLRHWELTRQLDWQPEADQANRSAITTAEQPSDEHQATIDLCVLIRAIYLRSLPPPSLEIAYNKDRLDSPSVRDRRVRDLVVGLVNSERVERSLRPSAGVIVQPIGGMQRPDRRWYFYGTWATVLAAYNEADKSTPKGANEAACAAQEGLEKAFLAWADEAGEGRSWAGRWTSANISLAAQEHQNALTLMSGLDLLVYVTYANNWLYLECVQIANQKPLENSHIFAWTLVSDTLDRGIEEMIVPRALEVNTRTTLLEFSYVARSGHQAGTSEEMNQVVLGELRALLDDIVESIESPRFAEHLDASRRRRQSNIRSLDPREAALATAYLRSRSPFLSGLWSGATFDAMWAKASAKQ